MAITDCGNALGPAAKWFERQPGHSFRSTLVLDGPKGGVGGKVGCARRVAKEEWPPVGKHRGEPTEVRRALLEMAVQHWGDILL